MLLTQWWKLSRNGYVGRLSAFACVSRVCVRILRVCVCEYFLCVSAPQFEVVPGRCIWGHSEVVPGRCIWGHSEVVPGSIKVGRHEVVPGSLTLGSF